MRPRHLKTASTLAATVLVTSLALGGAAWARGSSPAKAGKNPAGQPAGTAGKPAGKKPSGASGRTDSRPAKGDRGGATTARHASEAAAQRGRAAAPVRAGKSRGDEAGSGRTTDQIPRPDPGDRDRDRITRMQDTLTEILHNRILGRLHVGLHVMAARTGRLFYDRRGEALMDPASNQKVLATTAALMRLGGDWRYRTEVSGPAPDDDGVVHGNVYVRGNGDPTLRSSDLEQMAFHLRAVGITRIEGGVVADARLLGHDAPAGEEDDGGDTKAPLVVDRGMTVVRVRPGAVPGSPPVVLTEQRRFADDSGQNLGFAVRNQATTRASGRTRISVRVESAGGRVVVAVAGRIAAGAPSVAFRRRVPRPALHTAAVLRTALTASGIAVQEGASAGVTPAVATVLGVHESEPLTIVLRRINKESDNEQAERVLQTVGAEVFGAPATNDKGVAVLRNVIGSLGLKPNSYLPRNGSGLGHANRITADAMAELLRALYLDPRIGPEILQSLSVGRPATGSRARWRPGGCAPRRAPWTGSLACRAWWATVTTWSCSRCWCRASAAETWRRCARRRWAR
jgi:PBP4 family serine-type D-alanyl-D-alanine carboxypeptidase